MRNTCITCKYYDGEICNKDIDMDEVYDENELYKAPFDSCEDHEEEFDREGEDEE